MTDVKRLLEQATPLPWRVLEDDDPEGTGILGGGEEGSIDEGQIAWVESWGGAMPEVSNAALIVHAVNYLPAYEEAVDALERLLDALESKPLWTREYQGARASLSRLRGEK